MDPHSIATVPTGFDCAQWEELQRECHPFHAYVDYIHGKDARQLTPPPHSIRPFQLRRDRPLSISSIQSIPSPCPVRPSLGNHGSLSGPNQALPTSQTIPCFFRMSSAEVNSNLSLQPRNWPLQTAPRHQQHASPLAKAPTAMYMLKRDELLDPKFKDVSLAWRQELNDTVHTLYNTLESPRHPYPERIQARDHIIKVSTVVSGKAAEQARIEITLKNIHKELPRVYKAMRIRNKTPAGHPDSELAVNYLHDISKCLNDSAKSYAMSILKRMHEASQRGQDPLEAIPGYAKSFGVRGRAGKKRTSSSRK